MTDAKPSQGPKPWLDDHPRPLPIQQSARLTEKLRTAYLLNRECEMPPLSIGLRSEDDYTGGIHQSW
jgi:hypothetical protein